jgi:hypothetical protein
MSPPWLNILSGDEESMVSGLQRQSGNNNNSHKQHGQRGFLVKQNAVRSSKSISKKRLCCARIVGGSLRESTADEFCRVLRKYCKCKLL